MHKENLQFAFKEGKSMGNIIASYGVQDNFIFVLENNGNYKVVIAFNALIVFNEFGNILDCKKTKNALIASRKNCVEFFNTFIDAFYKSMKAYK